MTEIKKSRVVSVTIVVDVMGNLLSVFIHAVNIHDTKSGIVPACLACLKYPIIQRFCADAGYMGTFIEETKTILSRRVDISEKIKPHEWEKLKWRWVVERTFSWFKDYRRLSKDYEIKEVSSALMIMLSHIHTLLLRLWKQILIFFVVFSS